MAKYRAEVVKWGEMYDVRIYQGNRYISHTPFSTRKAAERDAQLKLARLNGEETNIYKIREFSDVKYGKFRGPTGRRRDLYSTYALTKKGIVGREYRHKDSSTKAYGRDGLRQAKKAIHHKAPHTWMHFHTRNMTKGRELQ